MATSSRGAPDSDPMAFVARSPTPASATAVVQTLADAVAAALATLEMAPHGHAVVLPRLSQPTPAAPAVLDELVDLLLEAGCADVTVLVAVSTADRDRGYPNAAALARAAGVTGRTRRGHRFEVAAADEEVVPAPVPEASVLAGAAVAARWVQADLRVVLGRSVTDIVDGYAGCLDTLRGAASAVPGAEDADVVADLLEHLPPHLALVDATVSSHGTDGARVPRELPTGSVLAATDALLADTVLARLMGEDRSTSRLALRATSRRDGPRGGVVGDVVGDLTPFVGWRPVPPAVRMAMQRVASDPTAARVLHAAIGGPDPGAQPGDPVLVAIRAVVTPLVRAGDEPAGRAALVGLLGAVAGAAEQAGAWEATMAKDRVRRRVVPLGFDPASIPDTEYDDLPGFLAPYERIVEALPGEPEGLRWCLVDGATVFETSRVIGADFGDFVERVDVAAGIGLMADYLGGRRVCVSADERGRPVRQAERNLYLPQPNYLAYWGGEPIDVCKIELVERGPEEHRLLWRTVASPNGSATWDDGSLTFTDAGPGRTRLTVRGRQLFSLPRSWQGQDLTAVPELRDPLLEEAYRRFFTTTFDNLEACFEGRPFEIGTMPGSGEEPLATVTVHRLVMGAAAWLRDQASGRRERPGWLGERSGASGRTSVAGAAQGEVDLHGFRHVKGT